VKAGQIEDANRVVKMAIELNADLQFVVLGQSGAGCGIETARCPECLRVFRFRHLRKILASVLRSNCGP